MKILTSDAIRAAAPAVYTEGHEMSDRYGFVKTADVIDFFADNGYFPVEAKQDRARERDPRYVRHAVILRPESQELVAVGDSVPQILVVNSHNGRTKLKLHAGIYRFVCCNGMVVGDDKFTASLKHSLDMKAQLAEYLKGFAQGFDNVRAALEQWSEIELNPRQTTEFAERAGKLRFGDSAGCYEAGALLEARREEDEGRTLWTVYNRVQENCTKGGMGGKNASGRVVRARELTGIKSDLEFNTNLWNLAAEYAA